MPLLAIVGLLVAGAGAHAQLACGGRVERGQTVTLAADLGPCDGVDAAAVVDGGTLDLAGYVLACDDVGLDGATPRGVVLLGKRATVRNGIVRGCRDGVVLSGAGRHRVLNVMSDGAIEHGFRIEPTASRNRLNEAYAFQSGLDGFAVLSGRNAFSQSRAAANGQAGFAIHDGADRNRLLGCMSHDNAGDGFRVAGRRTKLRSSIANANEGVGIDLLSGRNVVRKCSAQGNGGYDLVGCRGNTVKAAQFDTASPDCE